MATLTAYGLIRTWALANWTATPLRFENEAAEPPQGPDGEPAAFVLVEATSDVASQSSIGAGSPENELWRETGVASFHVFVPSGTGTERLRGHAETLMMALRGARFGPRMSVQDISINFGDPGQRTANWFFMTVAAVWLREF